LKLPAGVELPALRLGKEHDLAVVTAKHARVHEEATEDEADAGDVPAIKSADPEDKK
jgi:large subunit ribosomal protein L25